jgi:hypothetical protein
MINRATLVSKPRLTHIAHYRPPTLFDTQEQSA